jgi:diadenosine tetraphosphate (Ap4A) HIT family hydrolase
MNRYSNTTINGLYPKEYDAKTSIGMMDCPFCDIIEKNAFNIIYRDDRLLAILDHCPKNVGHFLIMPIRHVESIFELMDKEFLQFRNAAQRILLNPSNKDDFLERYEYYLSQTDRSDTRLIKKCRSSIDFLSNTPELIPSGFTCGFNEGAYSGKKHEHVHMHVVPAYENSANEHGFRALFC